MLIEITLSEDRANIFGDMKAIAKFCVSSNEESTETFKILFNIWEKVSVPLWNLCYWNDYSRCGHIVLNAARNINNTEVEAQLLAEMGYAYMEGEDYTSAKKYFQESLRQYQILQDFLAESRLLRYLGTLALLQDQEKAALNYYHQALEVLQARRNQIPNDYKLAMSEAELHNVMGNIYLNQENLTLSYQELSLSLEKYRAIGEQCRYFQAAPLLNLGRLYLKQEDYNQARQYYEECRFLCQEIGRTDMLAGVLLRLAELYEIEGKYEEALQFADESERIAGTKIISVRDHAALFKENLLLKIRMRS